MFTLYGNQYESREEHLLLTMFQVRYSVSCILLRLPNNFHSVVRPICSIRDCDRVRVTLAGKHPCFPDDDHLYPPRTRPELPEERSGGED